MIVWKLRTNEGVTYRRRKPTDKQMFAYIRAKRKQGLRLSEIVFSWGPIQVQS